MVYTMSSVVNLSIQDSESMIREEMSCRNAVQNGGSVGVLLSYILQYQMRAKLVSIKMTILHILNVIIQITLGAN